MGISYIPRFLGVGGGSGGGGGSMSIFAEFSTASAQIIQESGTLSHLDASIIN